MRREFTSELLNADISGVDDQQFLVTGELRINNEESWLAFGDQLQHRLDIMDKEFVARLVSAELPVWVGGKYHYADPVELVAQLGRDGGVWTIKSVGACKVFDDPLDGEPDVRPFRMI